MELKKKDELKDLKNQKEELEKCKLEIINLAKNTDKFFENERLKLENEKKNLKSEKLEFIKEREKVKKSYEKEKSILEKKIQRNKKHKKFTNLDIIHFQIQIEKGEDNIIINEKNLKEDNIDDNNKKDDSGEKNKFNLKSEKFEEKKEKQEDKKEEKEEENKKSNNNYGKEVNPNPKGLKNLGLSCYMNSILQCLYYIKEFRDYFIKEKDNFENEHQPVCLALSEVMYGLKNEKKDYYEAINFKKIMGNKNDLFYGKKAGDAKDLFFNLIDVLLTELKPDDNTTEEEEESSEEKEIDLFNKLEVFKEHEKELDNNIINKLFIGFYETSYFCPNNKNKITYSFQSESFLLFELEKIKNYFGTKELSISSCFNFYLRTQKKSSFFCNNCNKIEEGICKEGIYRPPKILVIILDRGHGKTFDGNVIFNEYLNLQNIINEENYKYSSFYQLISVSTHSGTSSSSGHYTARCLTYNNTYYYFSDKTVIKIDIKELFEDEPYILFYKRIEDQNIINSIKNNNKNKNIEIKKE